MSDNINLKVTDMHTAGEPVRIVTGGYPELKGATILERRRDALLNHDQLRALMMREPRGHAEMYGVIPTTPCHPDALMGVLFMHNAGYSTMCGHATIAMGRFLVDQGKATMVDGTAEFVLECPCGPVQVRVKQDGKPAPLVSFESVASYLHDRDLEVDTSRHGKVNVDVAYGGAYYALCTAAELGLDLRNSPLEQLKAAAIDITKSLRKSHAIVHPVEPDLGFLYGTIITESADVSTEHINHHLCFFADGQLDRSPTGSGVSARLAAACDRGQLQVSDSAHFAGVSGVAFDGRVSRPGWVANLGAFHTEVAGRAWYSGESVLTLEDGDPISEGYLDPVTAGEIWDR